MAPAGYSGTPLAKKLAVKDGHRVLLIKEPDGFRDLLDGLPDGVTFSTRAAGAFDTIVFFTKSRRELERRIPAMEKALVERGGLWISWPKKASKVPTDMTEDVVREVALPRGLVDVKVCAIDEIWSGLRLVRRKK